MPQVTLGEAEQRDVASLVVTHDDDQWVLSRPGLGIYLAVSEPGAVLVTALQRGASLAEATAEASWVAAEELDVEDFLRGLRSAGLFTGPAHGRAIGVASVRYGAQPDRTG